MAIPKKCAVKDLPRGDCSGTQAPLPDGTRSEYCLYHHRVFNGQTEPFLPDMYGKDSNGYYPFKKKEEVA